MTTIIITTLIGLILTAYGYIFRAVIKRIEKIEKKQSDCDIVFLEIKTSLARIEESILWLKEKK